ncbi:hypothetical protein [Staphylothermus hellenicus]|uniref:Uncharacterized protein n=1 Tax=Staphylothermus hellenicus (strain DSM 12710 / JCM 10830 / BK20S6-10-b1 / P8) TaxID=591019 RepID=D7DBS4_STAHD|nr:hypothetical protein [Staphylothermus hellenicus]ADI31621.1 hypothetical protein Shell_0490 [Staphylothermus hellenicus DSM 12710]
METGIDVWKLLKEEVLRPVDKVLSYDLEALRRTSEDKRERLWGEVVDAHEKFEEFMSELPGAVRREVLGEIELAKLLLATAAKVNGENNPIIDLFSSEELKLVERFERYSVFDILTIDEIVERVARRDEIYDLIMEYYKNEYSDLDKILEDPRIRRSLRYAFKKRYKKRLDKVKEGVKAYVEKYGPIIMVRQIEEKIWRKIKESEEERKMIMERLRRRMEELSLKLRPLEDVERKSSVFMDRLHDIESSVFFGEKTGYDEHEKDELLRRYLDFEKLLAEQVEAIEKEKRELENRRKELEKAEQEYRRKAEEEAQRIIESELRKIEDLGKELAKKKEELEEEVKNVRMKRLEIEETLKQVREAEKGEYRLVTSEDARLAELNFIARFDEKMHAFPLRIHSPIEGREYVVKSWREGERLKMSESVAEGIPSNLRLRYVITEKKHKFFGERVRKVVIEAISFNHLREFKEFGFDARKANLAEFLKLVEGAIDKAEIGKYFHVMGIASPTGWDDRVVREISSSEFARNYVSRYISVCLIDSITGDIYYNPADERITKFIEFFKPQFKRERVESVKKTILNKLSTKGYVVLDDVVNETREERRIVLKAFYDLEKEGKGKVKNVKDIGTVFDAESM